MFDEVKIIVSSVDLGSLNQSLSLPKGSKADIGVHYSSNSVSLTLSTPRGITADSLFPIAWDIWKQLASKCYHYCDKASPNQKRLHRASAGVTYKVANPYLQIHTPRKTGC